MTEREFLIMKTWKLLCSTRDKFPEAEAALLLALAQLMHVSDELLFAYYRS